MRLRTLLAITFVLLALFGANVARANDGASIPVVEDASCAGGQAEVQAARHAGLVVVFDDERVETFCIEFVEDEISGAELLRRSGLPVVVTGFGGLGTGVCRIDDVGCSDPTDCFCQCRGAECSYWAYYALQDGEWEYLPIGPSQRRLQDGDVDAWVWGSGRQRPATQGGGCPDDPPSPTPTRQPPSQGGAPVAISTAAVSGSTAAPIEPTVDSGSTPPIAQPTPADRATPQLRRGGNDVGMNGGRAAETPDDGSSGPPGGLIAFGAAAGVAIAAIGGLVLRRRLYG